MAESTPRPVPVLRPGEPFSPYKRFTGSFLPEPLERSTGVSDLAKVLWARLARYAGESAEAWPSVPTLAASIGRSPRTVQRGVRELERHGLIRIVSRPGRSSLYCLLWHGVFDGSAAINEPAEVVPIRPRQMRLPLGGAVEVVTTLSPLSGDNPVTPTPDRSCSPPLTTLSPEESQEENQGKRAPGPEDSPAPRKSSPADSGARAGSRAKAPTPTGSPPPGRAPLTNRNRPRLVKRGRLILPVPPGREPEPEFDAAAQLRELREQGLDEIARLLEADIAAEQPKEQSSPCP